MADPKLEEFCRAHDFKQSFLRDMQRYVRDEIQPKLEERERLLLEKEGLRLQVADLQQKTAKRRSEPEVPA